MDPTDDEHRLNYLAKQFGLAKTYPVRDLLVARKGKRCNV